jgi:nicotinamide riboside transporter PnuC
MSTHDEAVLPVPKWPRWLLRISLTVTAVLLFAQSISAGLFLTEVRAAFPVHREMATAAAIAVVLSIVAAILCVRLRRDVRWPIAATIGMLGLMSLQAFAGFRSLTALHVPLGVFTITLAIVFAGWAWIRDPQPTGPRGR